MLENIWIWIGIGVAILMAGSGILIFTGWGHRMMDWMKPTSDKYMLARVFCEDRQIRDRKLVVGRYVISDEKRKRSFYLVHDLLYAKPGSNSKFLALTERAARPIDFHNRVNSQAWEKYPTAQRVFIDTTADIRSQSSKDATNNFMAMSLSLIAISGAIVVVVIGIIIFFSNRGSA